jgi:hypothetical protein
MTIEVLKADDEVICGCFDLKRSDLERAVNYSGLSFERFLEETRAGSRCTACLLDVEYLFVNTPRVRSDAFGRMTKRRERRSAKQKLYTLLDRLSPLVPFRLVNTLPLLSGPDLVERLWLVNQPMVFGEKITTPPHRFDVTVRGRDGRILEHAQHDVHCGESRIIELPSVIRHDNEPFGIGSVEVSRRGLVPGVRGTTRPHFEIEAARSNTVLHIQGAGPNPEAWLTTIHNPANTRLLFSAVNTASRPLSIVFDAPREDGAPEGDTIHIEIPPRGARVVEPHLSDTESRRLQGRAITYHYRGRGLGKVHVITASRGLDRLSIDHL